MFILGINAFHGDSSACLLKDGVVVCAIEEERIRRIKHWAGFPSESIKFCLKDQNISINEVQYITISRNPKVNLFKKILYTFSNPINFFKVINRAKNSRLSLSIKSELSFSLGISISDITAKVYNIEHHRSHIGSSFFASPFKESAILSIDGFGDFTSTMTAFGKENDIKVIKELNYPHSLGIFYTTVTQFLGFPNYGDEYKVMGLAAYGKPKYLKELENIINVDSKGLFNLNKIYFKHFKDGIAMDWDGGNSSIESLFTKQWEDTFGKCRNNNEEIEQWHKDLACSVQKHTEKIIFYILNVLYTTTKSDNLCITGGVAQNSVVNGKILENTPFKRLYVPSAGNDAGTSIGSALYLYNQILGKKRLPEIKTSYFGYQANKEEIINALNSQNLNYRTVNDDELFEIVSEKIISGGVVGWFQGRAEFGPRALGHRSIIVDPRRKDVKDLLNDKIKRRESFRPFAPSILEEKANDYFDIDYSSPHMLFVVKAKGNIKETLPAIVHVDNTCRVQTVSKESNEVYYSLIKKFEEITGCPVLLNTSFNENEPIVQTPEEAFACFERTKMDCLVLENWVIYRA